MQPEPAGGESDGRRDFAALPTSLENLDPARWRCHTAGRVNDYPIIQVESVPATETAPDVLITSGVHGDEPAGVETVLAMLEEATFPLGVNYLIWPCLNPYGFVHDKRENRDGHDLNRVLLNPVGTEMDIVARTLEGRRFDLCLDLHEDWEAKGFYMYEGNANAQWLGPRLLEKVSQTGAIDTETDGSDIPLSPGLLQVDPAWGERGLASFLLKRHSHHVMIFETPTPWPLPQRVRAQRMATGTALKHYAETKHLAE